MKLAHRSRKGSPSVIFAAEDTFSLRNCKLTAAQIRSQIDVMLSSSYVHISNQLLPLWSKSCSETTN